MELRVERAEWRNCTWDNTLDWCGAAFPVLLAVSEGLLISSKTDLQFRSMRGQSLHAANLRNLTMFLGIDGSEEPRQWDKPINEGGENAADDGTQLLYLLANLQAPHL